MAKTPTVIQESWEAPLSSNTWLTMLKTSYHLRSTYLQRMRRRTRSRRPNWSGKLSQRSPRFPMSLKERFTFRSAMLSSRFRFLSLRLRLTSWSLLKEGKLRTKRRSRPFTRRSAFPKFIPLPKLYYFLREICLNDWSVSFLRCWYCWGIRKTPMMNTTLMYCSMKPKTLSL